MNDKLLSNADFVKRDRVNAGFNMKHENYMFCSLELGQKLKMCPAHWVEKANMCPIDF